MNFSKEYYPGHPLYQNKTVGGEDYYAVNHEIDIELPGRPSGAKTDISFDYALCNTWVGENEDEYTTNYTSLVQAQDDGNWHTYRFDWHTGDVDEQARVEFYFDDVLTETSYTNIPTNSGRFWIAAWFPNEWAGVPDFDISVFEVDYVKITPFNESGDRFVTGLADPYIADISEYPLTNAVEGLNPPANLNVTVVNEKEITVTWDMVEGAEAYDVDQNGVITSDVTSPYVITNLDNGTYAFKVRAKNTDSTSSWSVVRTATISINSENLLTNPNFEDDLFGWPNGVNASIEQVGENNAAKITSTELTGVLKQVVTGLQPNTTYTLTGDIVKCDTNVYGYLGVTDFGGNPIEHGGNIAKQIAPFTFRTGAANTAATIYLSVYKNQNGSVYFDNILLTGERGTEDELGIPVLSAIPDGNQVTLSWTAVEGATGYDIDRDGVTFSNVTSPYLISDLMEGTYSFKVRAKNNTATGNWSGVQTITLRSSDTNLVQNPNFDFGLNGWVDSINATVIEVNGNNAVKIVSTDVTGLLRQVVTGLQPNTTYRLNGDIVQCDANVYGYLGVSDYGGSTIEYGGNVPKTIDSITFTTGVNNTTATIYLSVYKNQGGEVFFDNISLIPVS
ncbi:hypothetical protein [Anaerocolumna sp.]|uniref:hypothetical protein n=1 Tax=Anaerocolumna sp. TaxID=2041569 RepID=UPI0028A70947|nr:hypothetical protein [Anaerocolumna sp.]